MLFFHLRSYKMFLNFVILVIVCIVPHSKSEKYQNNNNATEIPPQPAIPPENECNKHSGCAALPGSTCSLSKGAPDVKCHGHTRNYMDVILLCTGVPFVAALIVVYTVFKLKNRQRNLKAKLLSQEAHWTHGQSGQRIHCMESFPPTGFSKSNQLGYFDEGAAVV